MQITTKIIEDDAGNTETRYFGETEDSFDGTAQGYGLKKSKTSYWQQEVKVRFPPNPKGIGYPANTFYVRSSTDLGSC
jgi:hypothetical protein